MTKNPLSPRLVGTALSLLEAADLIRLAQTQPEVEYLFRHALVHEAAHDSLVKSDRRKLHQAAAEALERLYSARLDSRELAPLLARHFDEAGDPQRALHYYALAGQAAVEGYANAEAVRYFTLALAAAGAREAASQVVADL